MESRLEETLARIEALTAQLESASNAAMIDPIAMRVMLDEYLSALEQLRAGVREAERRLSSVATTIDDGTKLVRKERKKGTKGLGD